MLKKFIMFVLVASMAFGIVACSGSKSGTDEKVEDVPPVEQEDIEKAETDDVDLIEIGISTHPAQHSLPTFCAIANGEFEAAGLNVSNTTYISGLPQMEALPSGEWSCGVAGIPATITGVLSYDLRIIGFSLWDDCPHCLYARPDSDIVAAGQGNIEGYPEIYGTPDLYRGKTFLIAKGTAGYLNVLANLKAMGLTEDDVNIVHMEISAAYQAFKAGEGDILVTWSTFTYNADDEGWIKVSSAAAAGLRMPSPIIASDEIIRENPEAVQRYMNVFIDSMQWMSENPDEVIDIYYDVCLEEGVDSTHEICEKAMEIQDTLSIQDMEELLQVDENGLNGYQKIVENVLDFYIATGERTEEDKKKVLENIDTSFLEEAIEYYKQNH